MQAELVAELARLLLDQSVIKYNTQRTREQREAGVLVAVKGDFVFTQPRIENIRHRWSRSGSERQYWIEIAGTRFYYQGSYNILTGSEK